MSSDSFMIDSDVTLPVFILRGWTKHSFFKLLWVGAFNSIKVLVEDDDEYASGGTQVDWEMRTNATSVQINLSSSIKDVDFFQDSKISLTWKIEHIYWGFTEFGIIEG